MANKKRKTSPSVFGVIALEGIAIVAFVILLTQAKAERQRQSTAQSETLPVLQQMLERTPFRNFLAQH